MSSILVTPFLQLPTMGADPADSATSYADSTPHVNTEYPVFGCVHCPLHKPCQRICGCMHLLSSCSSVALAWIHLGWAAAWRVSHKILGGWQDLSSITILSVDIVSIAQLIPKFSEDTSLCCLFTNRLYLCYWNHDYSPKYKNL